MTSLWFSLDVIPVALLKMKANLITRYKSLCLGLLGQLKKMHIQLPILYVVKVQLHIILFSSIYFVQNNLFTISTLLEDKEMALMWAKDLLKMSKVYFVTICVFFPHMYYIVGVKTYIECNWRKLFE